jgi:hypothetical protein
MQMDEIRLRQVTFAELSGLRHEIFTSEAEPYCTPEFLVIRYAGVYRYGSEGHGDALYIVATAESARKAWYSDCTVLDFRDLQYAWGDEMEWILAIGSDQKIGCHEPLAVLVGDRCKEALESLFGDDYQKFCVNTMEEAFALCRRQKQEYQRILEEWRDRA